MADERKYYVLCQSNCKFESMTKEQILAAIEQAANDGKITNVDTGFVTKIKELNRRAALSFWVGTSAEYNALENKEQNCFYIITDDTTGDDLNALIEEINARIEALEATVTKNGATLISLGDQDLTGQTISKITEYTLVKVLIQKDGVYMPVLCVVDINTTNKTFILRGTNSTPSTTSITQFLMNNSVNICGTLNGNDGIVTTWNLKMWTITGVENKITAIEDLDSAMLKIIGIM